MRKGTENTTKFTILSIGLRCDINPKTPPSSPEPPVQQLRMSYGTKPYSFAISLGFNLSGVSGSFF